MIVHTTDRLTLRRVTLDDAPFVYELVTDPDWLRFIGDRGVKTVVDAAAYLARAYLPHYERHGFGLYVVEPRGNGGPLGLCGLLKRDTLEHPDIGFAFLPHARGTGSATEAARVVLAHAHDVLGFRRVIAIANPENAGSRRVLTKIGMRDEGVRAMGEPPEDLALYASER